MTELTVEIQGLENLQKAQEAVAQKLSDGSLVMRAALVIERQAKKNASGRPGPRVRTGRLRASILPEQVDNNTARVGTNVVYAPFVEFGTKRAPAYPYLVPAVEQCKGELEGVMVTFGTELGAEWGK
jgi:HK97 gp10 family phage protein